MATRVDNTMVEWIQKSMKSIAEAKLLPDADMAFLVTIENQFIEQAKGQGGSGSPNAMTQAGLLPPAQPMSSTPAPSYGGVMGSPAMPGGDELRRVLAPAAGPQ